MKVKHIVYSLLIIGFAALVIYRISAGKEESKGGMRKGPSGPMRVDGFVTVPQDFSHALSVTGTIEADELVNIQSEISGLVRGIYFREGGTVQKGQLLIKIDDSELQAQLAQAKTRKELAAENEHRAKLLLQKEAISREEYDISLADLKSSQAQEQLIQAQLAKTSIRAPFSGKIGLRFISEGSFLTPQAIVTSLVRTNPVKITFSVPEKYASQIKLNTPISFTVKGFNKEFSAVIYAIEPNIETATRTLKLRAETPNPGNQLLPGSFASIELPLSTVKDAILIPTQAIIPVQDGKKVFIAVNGKAKEVKVETEDRTENSVLIRSGLDAGDTVLTTGIMTLKEGLPVKVNVN